MRKLSLFVAIALLASCGSGEKPETMQSTVGGNQDEAKDSNLEVTVPDKTLTSDSREETSAHKIPVEVKTLTYETFNHYFEASGIVEPVKEAIVSPEINGQIKEIYVGEGEHVKKGQLLARLNTTITDNTIKEVKTSLELASILYKKQKELWEKKIGSEIQYLEAKNRKEALEGSLETLKAQKEMASIKSPIAGIVDDMFLKEGELAGPGVPMMQVINLDKLYVNIDVSERYIPFVKKGDKVILQFPTYPDLEMEVPVYRTGNIIKPDNRTFTLQLKIANDHSKFKPNMVAITRINDFATDSALVVPSLIIKQDLTGKYIYVVNRTNGITRAEKRYIEPGFSYNENTIIDKGIAPGEQVIVTGYTQVSDGSDIDIKNQ